MQLWFIYTSSRWLSGLSLMEVSSAAMRGRVVSAGPGRIAGKFN